MPGDVCHCAWRRWWTADSRTRPTAEAHFLSTINNHCHKPNLDVAPVSIFKVDSKNRSPGNFRRRSFNGRTSLWSFFMFLQFSELLPSEVHRWRWPGQPQNVRSSVIGWARRRARILTNQKMAFSCIHHRRWEKEKSLLCFSNFSLHRRLTFSKVEHLQDYDSEIMKSLLFMKLKWLWRK